MELQTFATPIKNQPNLAPLNQPANLTLPQMNCTVVDKRLLQENRQKFDQHVARLTKLQRLVAAEERIIADCLAQEKLLLALLEQKINKAS